MMMVSEKKRWRSPYGTPQTLDTNFARKENYAKNGICVFQNRGVIVGSSSAETLKAEEQDVWKPC